MISQRCACFCSKLDSQRPLLFNPYSFPWLCLPDIRGWIGRKQKIMTEMELQGSDPTLSSPSLYTGFYFNEDGWLLLLFLIISLRSTGSCQNIMTP